MTLNDLIPALRGSKKPKHRADDRIREQDARHAAEMAKLREENVALLNRQAAADDFFMLQDAYRTSLEAELAEEKKARTVAENATDGLREDRDEWRDEALRLRARFGAQIAAEANANAVTVPPMVRPIDGPQDEATAPIDVRPLWDALNVGPTTAVTDPGQVR